MNERIQELIDQCEGKYSTQSEPCHDMEKLVESTVRKCLKLLGPESAYAKEHIKKYFGVKE